MEKILYIYPEDSTFTGKDIRFLSKRFEVRTPAHNWRSKAATPLNFFRQFLFLSRHLRGAVAVFVMFGGYWSLLPALAGKITGLPVYIIPGGTDCVSFPSLNYGSLRKPLMRAFIRWSFRLCTELLPVHGSLVESAYSYHNPADYPAQGYKYFFPGITTPYRVINNGFDPDFFACEQYRKRTDSFIVVAPVTSMTRVKLKGIDRVLFLAGQFSHCSFTLVGVSDAVASELGPLPENVVLHPYMPQEEFLSLLCESQFILQLSVSEGFPNALCEAMLCRCIPVGSSVGPVPEIIGETGFVMRNSDREYLTARFREITLTSSTGRHELGRKARERIVQKYHISRREEAFFDLIGR